MRSEGLRGVWTWLKLCVCVSETESSNSSVCGKRLYVFTWVPTGNWLDTLFGEPVMAAFPFEHLLCSWRQKVSGWPCFPRAKGFVPYTVAQFPSHFCHYNSSGDLCEVRVKTGERKKETATKKQGHTTHFILKLPKHSFRLISSMHLNGFVEEQRPECCPVQSLKQTYWHV